MKEIENIKILVIGDIMLDCYVVGDVTRISPEAPVPIVNVTDEYVTLGGCGNVVRNLRTLGAKVDCLSFIGRDTNGQILMNELKQIGVDPNLLIYDSYYQTIMKTRIIANDRKVQMLRIDHEKIQPVDSKQAILKLKTCKNDYDVIIISDYAKGMITHELMEYLKTYFDSDIIVDPKPAHGYMYDDVFMMTPNEKEWASMTVTSQYRFRNIPYILETKGKDGMVLHDLPAEKHWPIESVPVEVFNVSGAGDTVVAVMSLCISMGYPVLQSAIIANHCAAYVVTQTGTSTVPKNIFQKGIEMFEEK
jgi:D-beta-D-heptose 7-phosphate kinase/D-beta-D-heptose 1-phosphate adenosyltransferase